MIKYQTLLDQAEPASFEQLNEWGVPPVNEQLAACALPCFQPIIEVASGKIHSYEALARQFNSQGELLSLGHIFTDPKIPNDNKLWLDRILRERALEAALSLPTDTSIAVNISPQWINRLNDGDYIPTLEMIERIGIDPKNIIVELTEFCGDIDRILNVVKSYRDAGIRIAIDDFGAGFSQLDRVIALEPDIIKLDMQLFKQAVKGGIAETVVESLARLGVRSGAQIVCEGVETVEEFHFGLKCGARFMQGYLFSQACPTLLDVDFFTEQVAELRTSFFQKKCQQESQKIDHVERIKKLITHLQKLLLQPDSNPLSVLQDHEQSSELLRFYICNREGTQLTPNYNYHAEQKRWSADHKPEGYNWAWRPYFYQLTALVPRESDRLVASSLYQDLASGQPCKTLATLLDDDRVLLVDVLARWE